jgi:putative peptide zinc metalloprotease protein
MSGAERPRLKPGLRFLRRVEDGRAYFVVKDAIRMKYFRFGEPEVALMQKLDGERTVSAVASDMGADPAAVDAFVRRLKEMGLAEQSGEEQRILLMEALRKQRRLRMKGHGNTLFRARFSFGDPDALFDRVIDRIRFFFTPGFVAVSAAAFLAYFVIITLHWPAVAAGMTRLYDPTQFTVAFVVSVYLTAAVIFLAHELGHGLACKHFGGEVHEMGAMLFYFSPAFFCNVNDAWTFEKRSDRLWVTFAGGWIQLFIGSIAALIWIVAEPGTLLEQTAFMGIVLGGGIILLVNFNPLLPLDGYYALMDGLKIPNLRPRSFHYLGAWVRRAVLRLDVPVPHVTPRERRIFLAYGISALAYTTLVITVVGLFIGGFIVRAFGGWGWALIALIAASLLRDRARAGIRIARVWAADKLGPGTREPWLRGAVTAAAMAVLIGFIPWTLRATGPATVEPLDRVWIRATEAGTVVGVLVGQGDTVYAGQPLFVLRSPDLEIELAAATAAAASLQRVADAARSAGRIAEARRAELDLEFRLAEVAGLQRRHQQLQRRAPFDGVVVTPYLETELHARVAPGDSLVELWSAGPLRLRVALEQRHAGDVRVGAPVGVRFPTHPDWTWRSHVAQVRPATRDGHVEILAPLGDAELRPGLTGTARISVRKTNIAGAVAHAFFKTFRTDLAL